MSLLYVEDVFRGVVPLNPKVDIVPVISYLPELLVGHNIGVKPRDIGNVL